MCRWWNVLAELKLCGGHLVLCGRAWLSECGAGGGVCLPALSKGVLCVSETPMLEREAKPTTPHLLTLRAFMWVICVHHVASWVV